VAKEGNFAVRLLKDEDNKVVDQGLKLIDAQGLILRDAGTNPETIARNAWLFGFDTQPLTKLAAAAAMVSADLGKAVQQASVKNTFTIVSTANSAYTAHMPVMTMAADKAKLLGLSGLALLSTSQSSTSQSLAKPVVTAQKDPHTSSPSLEQVLQQASTKALEHFDSATYLSSLFKA
jgi:hypothetical protein